MSQDRHCVRLVKNGRKKVKYAINEYPSRFDLIPEEHELADVHPLGATFSWEVSFSHAYLRTHAREQNLRWAEKPNDRSSYPVRWRIESESLIAQVFEQRSITLEGPSEDEWGTRSSTWTSVHVWLEYTFPLDKLPKFEMQPLCAKAFHDGLRYVPVLVSAKKIVANWDRSLLMWMPSSGTRIPKRGITLNDEQSRMARIQQIVVVDGLN